MVGIMVMVEDIMDGSMNKTLDVTCSCNYHVSVISNYNTLYLILDVHNIENRLVER